MTPKPAAAPKADPWAGIVLPNVAHPWVAITCAEFRQEVAALRAEHAGDADVKTWQDGTAHYTFGGRLRLVTITVAGRCHHQRAGRSAVAWASPAAAAKAREAR